MRDLRYALRGLRRQPLFTLVAVLTLAIGSPASQSQLYGVGKQDPLVFVVAGRALLAASVVYGPRHFPEG